MHRKLAVLLAAAAATVAGADVARADASSPAELLARYQPVTFLDSREAFAPAPVESFLHQAELQALQPDGTYAAVATSPDAAALPKHDPEGCTSTKAAPCLRLDYRGCSPAAGIAALPCYAASRPDRSVVYGRYRELDDDTVVLQYWYFYVDDLWSLLYPPSDFAWQAHEGDWEAVAVVLDEDEQPLEVATSRHCGGAVRPWASVQRAVGTDHPVIYVAVGSHANYFGPGVHPMDLGCFPQFAQDLFRQNGITPLDFTFPNRALGPGQTAVERLRGSSSHWLRFPGTWGEAQWVHAAPLGAPFPFGTSPVGPLQHDLWQDPLQTIAGWTQEK
jgi:hypothetical protein